MKHADFRRQLDEFVDGILPEPARLEMERHAAECRDCAGELAAVRRIVEAAQQLPREIEPGRDVWRRIEAGFGGGISAAPPSRWPHLVRPRLRLAFAAACAAVVVLVAGLLFELDRQRTRTAAPEAAVDFATLLPASLSGLERQCMGAGQLLQAALRLPAGTPTREAAESLAPGLAAGLTILDRSIDDMRQALAADPGNLDLQCSLAARYQQKLAMLQSALMRVETT